VCFHFSPLPSPCLFVVDFFFWGPSQAILCMAVPNPPLSAAASPVLAEKPKTLAPQTFLVHPPLFRTWPCNVMCSEAFGDPLAGDFLHIIRAKSSLSSRLSRLPDNVFLVCMSGYLFWGKYRFIRFVSPNFLKYSL